MCWYYINHNVYKCAFLSHVSFCVYDSVTLCLVCVLLAGSFREEAGGEQHTVEILLQCQEVKYVHTQ